MKKEHENKDDKEGVKDGLRENITEMEIFYCVSQIIREFFVQGIESSDLVVVHGKCLLKTAKIDIVDSILDSLPLFGLFHM
jgi:hypothetical protein